MPTTQVAKGSSSQSQLAADVLFKVGEARSESRVFQVSDNPLKITWWLPVDVGTDQIVFYRVLDGDASCIRSTGCCIKSTGGVAEIARLRYKICDCEPKLTADTRWIVIDQSGKYQAVLQKSDTTQSEHVGQTLVMVDTEQCEISDKLRGCCG